MGTQREAVMDLDCVCGALAGTIDAPFHPLPYFLGTFFVSASWVMFYQ